MVSVLVAGALSLGLWTAPASAQFQGGLVNVAVGNVTILEDVRVGLALAVAANICGLKVSVLSADFATDNVAICRSSADGQTVRVQ